MKEVQGTAAAYGIVIFRMVSIVNGLNIDYSATYNSTCYQIKTKREIKKSKASLL